MKLYHEIKSNLTNTHLLSMKDLFKSKDPTLAVGFFIADINNDGKDEYIWSTFNGSGGYLGLHIFSKNNGKYTNINEPPKPKIETRDGPWYSYMYRNKKIKKYEFLVEECGKIYMQFTSNGNDIEKYIWENGNTKKIK